MKKQLLKSMHYGIAESAWNRRHLAVDHNSEILSMIMSIYYFMKYRKIWSEK